MKEQFERTSLLIGEEAINKLNNSKVLIFGVGGVGGYVAEALARTGVGSITIVDKDTVSESNINRQIIALHSTVGKDKVDVLKERMLDINLNLQVDAKKCFFLPENAHEFGFSQYDYIVDAVDTVTAKLQIIVQAKEAGVPVISAMGAGNKVHPEMFEIADIYKTEMCPLAKVMRRELKNRGIKKLKVVYSKEKPVYKGDVPGSIAFSPSVAGLLMASEVVRELCEVK